MSEKYTLSKQIYIHSDDVRSILILPGEKLITGSADTVLSYTELSETTSNVSNSKTSEYSHSNLVSDICLLKENVIATACYDKYIRIYTLKEDGSFGAPEAIFADDRQISSLSKLGDDKLLSGSWSGVAKIWKLNEQNGSIFLTQLCSTGQLENNLCVLGLYGNQFLVGSSGERGDNKVINAKVRMYQYNDSSKQAILRKEIQDHKSSVRGLCRSENMFFSCGNDGMIFGYSLEREEANKEKEFGSLSYGFCFSVSFSDGKIFGAYDDLCCRIFDVESGELVVVKYPSTVWKAVPDGNKLYLAGNDKVLRVFSKDPADAAEASVIQTYEGTIKAQRDKLEENKKRQTEDVQRNGVINGETFDYVFKIEVTSEENPSEMRNLRLGFNLFANPYVVAQEFCAKNKLPMDNVEAIVQFINQHASQEATSQVQQSRSFFPLETSAGFYFSLKENVLRKSLQGAITAMVKHNDGFYKEDESKRLSSEEIAKLQTLAETLGETGSYHGSKVFVSDLAPLQKVLTLWNIEHINPVCQCVRLVLLHPDAVSNLRGSGNFNVWIELVCSILDNTFKYNTVLTASWVLSNAFRFTDSIPDVLKSRVKIVAALKELGMRLDPKSSATNKMEETAKQSLKDKAIVAATTVALNLANALAHFENIDTSGDLVIHLSSFLETVTENFSDVEVKRRAALAYGCLLSKNLLGVELKSHIQKLEAKLKEGIEVQNDSEMTQKFLSLLKF
eukprot:augustus_masked-scaffold_58-processed-gene-0.4-mRNA-1 protein AED:1.00 eAED:1.00 QI:0/-1/0/0/-1/1/1/0/731